MKSRKPKKKSLIVKPVACIRAGDMYLSRWPDGTYYVCTIASGEGFETDEKKVEKMLRKFFEKEF